MKLIFCLDDARGVSLFGKRQSRDRYLCDNIIADTAGITLETSAYSAKLFDTPVKIVESPSLGEDSAYFCEAVNPMQYIHDASTVVIYYWNRRYPSDVRFDTDMSELGFRLDASEDFVGYSHEKITKETYVRNEK